MHSSIFYMSGAARGCVCRTCLVALLILFALSAQARDGSLPGNDEACGSTQDTACDSLCVLQKAGASPSGSLCMWREADVITADSRAQADSLLASTMEGDSIVPLLPSDSLPKGVVLADVVVTGGATRSKWLMRSTGSISWPIRAPIGWCAWDCRWWQEDCLP